MSGWRAADRKGSVERKVFGIITMRVEFEGDVCILISQRILFSQSPSRSLYMDNQ